MDDFKPRVVIVSVSFGLRRARLAVQGTDDATVSGEGSHEFKRRAPNRRESGLIPLTRVEVDSALQGFPVPGAQVRRGFIRRLQELEEAVIG